MSLPFVRRSIATCVLVWAAAALFAQAPPTQRPGAPEQTKFDAFEVATIKPVDWNAKSGRYIVMDGPHRFVAKGYTLKLLIAAAYELNPKTISGGPAWIDSDHFDLLAITPGDARPTHDEQMAMLRALLAERFQLTFHREPKEFAIYLLDIAPGRVKLGPKLKPSTAPPDEPPALIGTVYPQRIVIPARNATMQDLASMMQRAILDRPVVDRTGLTGRYDFDLAWAPDESQYGGDVPAAAADAPAPPLFTAIQEQLGLRLQPTHGTIDALVIDKAERPSAN